LKKAGLSPDSLQVVMEATSPEALKGLVAITRLSDEIANDAIHALNAYPDSRVRGPKALTADVRALRS